MNEQVRNRALAHMRASVATVHQRRAEEERQRHAREAPPARPIPALPEVVGCAAAKQLTYVAGPSTMNRSTT